MDSLKGKRNGTVDVFRLLYAIVIMTGHSVTVGVKSPFPFEPVGILVEFFLFLTGYFTCVSIENHTRESSEYFTYALQYTYKKFRVFIPYLIVSVGLSYSISIISEIQHGGGIRQLGSIVYRMLSEMFLLDYVFAEVGQRVGALFFLAALLIVFPAFCLLCQVKNNNIKLFAAIYAMVFYYRDTDAAVTATYPRVLLRVASGLCTGILIYYAVDTIKGKKWIEKNWIGIFAVGLLATPLILSGLHILNRRIPLICEYTGLILALSNSRFCNH